MEGINCRRAVIGGILAGVLINASEFVFNTVAFGSEMQQVMSRMNLPPFGAAATAAYAALGFALGFVAVWIYAAIRPRYGAGPATALRAAAAVWVLAYVYGAVGMAVMGIFSVRLMVIALTWGLAELFVATLAGAYVYRE